MNLPKISVMKVGIPIALLLLNNSCKNDTERDVINIGNTISDTLRIATNTDIDVIGLLEVLPGGRLEISAGCTVNFESGGGMLIRGDLVVMGTASSRVVFGNESTQWSVQVDGSEGGINSIRFAKFTGAAGALRYTRCDVNLFDSQFTDNQLGIQISGNESGLIEGCYFNHNDQSIVSSSCQNIMIRECVFDENTTDVNSASLLFSQSRNIVEQCHFENEGLVLIASDHDRTTLENVIMKNCMRGIRYLTVAGTKLHRVEFEDVDRCVQFAQFMRDSLDIKECNFVDCGIGIEYLQTAFVYVSPRAINLPGLYWEQSGEAMDSLSIQESVIDAMDMSILVDTLRLFPVSNESWLVTQN